MEKIKGLMRAKTVLGVTVAALTLLLVMVGNGSAITLGLPDISFDSSQGPGANTFTTQGVHYNAGTGLLGVSAKAQSITFDGVTYIPLVGGKVDYQAHLTSSSSGGGHVLGNFGTDGVFGNDLIIQDTSGILLEGDFVSYLIDGTIGSNRGSGEALFSVTGGSLAGLFGADGGMVNLYFNVSPHFSATTFASNFSGQTKGDVAALVPEPASLILLGSGLAGLGFWGRKKFKGV